MASLNNPVASSQTSDSVTVTEVQRSPKEDDPISAFQTQGPPPTSSSTNPQGKLSYLVYHPLRFKPYLLQPPSCHQPTSSVSSPFSHRLTKSSKPIIESSKMVVQTIYLTRHGVSVHPHIRNPLPPYLQYQVLTPTSQFRSNWVVDPQTGTYTSPIPSPTGIPSDPALASHGVSQSLELRDHLLTLSPTPSRIYSSPYYRCLQTITPTVLALQQRQPPSINTPSNKTSPLIRAEPGLGEWYGLARFTHPEPAPIAQLHPLFPTTLDAIYTPKMAPPRGGESIADLHSRTMRAVREIVREADGEAGVEALIICTHAATLLAVGRALVGRVPECWAEEDFGTWTCGLVRFERRRGGGESATTSGSETETRSEKTQTQTQAQLLAETETDREGLGYWDCTVNGETGYLKGGRERGWWFQGEEDFDTSVVVVAAVRDQGTKDDVGGRREGDAKGAHL